MKKILKKIKKALPPGGVATARPPPPAAEAVRPRWPIEPEPDETASTFIQRCHERELLSRGTGRAVREFVLDRYESFSGEDGEELATWLLKARTSYWLNRCEMERAGRIPTEGFWKNYDAAMAGKVDRFDPIIRDAIRFGNPEALKTEGNAMATTAHKKSEPKKVAKVAKVAKKIPARADKSANQVVAERAKKSAAKPVVEKKDLVLGSYVGTALCRWIGKQKIATAIAKQIMHELGADLKDSTIQIQVNAGAKGERGDPAEVTKEHAAKIKNLVEKFSGK